MKINSFSNILLITSCFLVVLFLGTGLLATVTNIFMINEIPEFSIKPKQTISTSVPNAFYGSTGQFELLIANSNL